MEDEFEKTENQISDSINVWISKEFGQELWVWQPIMTGQALEEWWCKLSTVGNYFTNPTLLPGKVFYIETENQRDHFMKMNKRIKFYYCHLFTDENSYLERPDGAIIHHKGRNLNH